MNVIWMNCVDMKKHLSKCILNVMLAFTLTLGCSLAVASDRDVFLEKIEQISLSSKGILSFKEYFSVYPVENLEREVFNADACDGDYKNSGNIFIDKEWVSKFSQFEINFIYRRRNTIFCNKNVNTYSLEAEIDKKDLCFDEKYLIDSGFYKENPPMSPHGFLPVMFIKKVGQFQVRFLVHNPYFGSTNQCATHLLIFQP